MAGKRVVLTQKGLDDLKSKLEFLETVRRNEVIEKIKVARSYGDLSENSEYDEAKNEQAKVEAEIADLTVMLQNAEVIDESKLSNDTVNLGSTVKVRIVTDRGEREKEYQILGSNEANPREGKISMILPLERRCLAESWAKKWT